MNQSKVRSFSLMMLAVLLCVVFLTGCAGQKLSPDFDEAAVRAAAENVISLINDQETDEILALCTVQMGKALTDDVMKQIYEAIGEGGAFSEIKDMRLSGTTDKTSDEEYAVVVVLAQYEVKQFTFTISLTKQMKLAGLYYR